MEKQLSVALRALAHFKSAKKGRRDAKDAEDAEACVVACMVVSMITLPLVVALFCSCCRKGNFQALVCSPTRMQRRGASARDGLKCEVSASLWRPVNLVHHMHRLRILIVFWASTLVDEICPIALKDKAISKAKLIPLVFFRRHVSATSAASASLRPFGVSCIALAGWKSMEKRFGAR